jgi:plasmid stabilization system protein ParE
MVAETRSDAEGSAMPRGDKSAYTDKQKRKAEHIEEGYEDRGVSKKEAERRAWATVNAESGGGKLSGSGRGKKENRASSKKGARKAAASRKKSAGGRKKSASGGKKSAGGRKKTASRSSSAGRKKSTSRKKK